MEASRTEVLPKYGKEAGHRMAVAATLSSTCFSLINIVPTSWVGEAPPLFSSCQRAVSAYIAHVCTVAGGTRPSFIAPIVQEKSKVVGDTETVFSGKSDISHNCVSPLFCRKKTVCIKQKGRENRK